MSAPPNSSRRKLFQHFVGLSSVPAVCCVSQTCWRRTSPAAPASFKQDAAAPSCFFLNFILFFLLRTAALMDADKSELRIHLSQSVPVHALLKGMCLLPEVEL